MWERVGVLVFCETETMLENDWHRVSFRHVAVPERAAILTQ